MISPTISGAAAGLRRFSADPYSRNGNNNNNCNNLVMYQLNLNQDHLNQSVPPIPMENIGDANVYSSNTSAMSTPDTTT